MIRGSIPWNCKQIAKMFENNSIRFDNAIQRGEVWDIKRKSLFIDSIIKGFPVPPIFAIKLDEKVKDNRGRDVSVFDCIDGKQRCTAIFQFFNNQFSLVLDEDNELNGLTYDKLNEEQQENFNTYSVSVQHFMDITDDEVAEMMARLNNGKPLTGIENARIKATDLASIIELAKHPVFTDFLTENQIKGYSNEDLVIKTYMQVYEGNYELSSKNVKGVYEAHTFSYDEKHELTVAFDKAYEVISAINNDYSKKLFKKVTTKTNLCAVLNFIFDNRNDDAAKLTHFLAEFYGTTDTVSVSESYNEAMTNGTNHSGNVDMRNVALIEKYEEYSSDYTANNEETGESA